MAVRAKFRVSSVTWRHDIGSDQKVAAVELMPVTSGSEENKQFYHYTPAGKIELSTINEAAANQFKPGQEFYIDFTAAE